MTVLGEHSKKSSDASFEADAFGLPRHQHDVRRPGRRRGARARARAFSTRSSRREQRRAWDVDALKLPAPLLTAQPAKTLSGDQNDTAQWLARPVKAIDLSDRPRLIIHPETGPTAGPDAGWAARAVPAPRQPTPGQLLPGQSALDQPVLGHLLPHPFPGTVPSSVGRSQLPDPVQRVTESSRLPETLIATVLALVAGLAAWGTTAPQGVWVPLAALPAVGLIALLLPGGTWARVIRAAGLLTAAAALPVLAPSMTPVTLVVALAVAALYPMLVTPIAGRVITLLAIACLTTPLVTAILVDGPANFVDYLLSADGDLATAVRLALGSGVLVVALIGGSAMAAKRLLTATASIAVSRERTARVADARLGRASSCDAATGLANRAAFLRAVTIALTDGNGRVGVVLIDIDRFADLADRVGANAADRAAVELAARLRGRYPSPTMLARVSRHQFALLLTDATHDDCADLARDITALLTTPVRAGRQETAVTCSMGAALAGPQLQTAEELLQAADEAARAAQRSGRSRWLMFDQNVRTQALSRATLEFELRDAVRTGTIEVAFQPILGLGEGVDDRIVGVEVLARWTRADGNVVEPERFIPMADELGLGVALGMQVIQKSLEALTGLRQAGVIIDQVWVNLAPSQLDDPEFAHEVAAQLAIRGLPAGSLVLEISAGRLTESQQCLATLSMLRSLGIAVALDDFGRSGTSLSALRRLPISAVKLDPSLTADLGRQDAVPRAMTQLCRTLGLRVVVEGIETMTQLHGAREIEADAVQGFAIARPLSLPDITDLLTLRVARDDRPRRSEHPAS